MQIDTDIADTGIDIDRDDNRFYCHFTEQM